MAGGKPYMVTVRMPASDSAVLYGGWPWNYKVHLRPFQCGINQDSAAYLRRGLWNNEVTADTKHVNYIVQENHHVIPETDRGKCKGGQGETKEGENGGCDDPIGPMSSYFSKPKNSLVLPEKLWLSLMDITKRYEDDCPVAVPKPSSLLLEPLIRDHPLVVRFTDRECQSSNIVGGKGSSLALLSTLRDQKLTVCIIERVFNKYILFRWYVYSGPMCTSTRSKYFGTQTLATSWTCHPLSTSGKPLCLFPVFGGGVGPSRSAMLASQEVVRKSASDIPMVSCIIDPKLPSDHLMEKFVPLGREPHGEVGPSRSAMLASQVVVRKSASDIPMVSCIIDPKLPSEHLIEKLVPLGRSPHGGVGLSRSTMLASQEVVRKSASDILMVSCIIDPKLPSEHLMEKLVPLGVRCYLPKRWSENQPQIYLWFPASLTLSCPASTSWRSWSLLECDVLVPPGLCLTVAAFQTQLEECSQLQKEITTLEQIVQGKLSGDLKQQCENLALHVAVIFFVIVSVNVPSYSSLCLFKSVYRLCHSSNRAISASPEVVTSGVVRSLTFSSPVGSRQPQQDVPLQTLNRLSRKDIVSSVTSSSGNNVSIRRTADSSQLVVHHTTSRVSTPLISPTRSPCPCSETLKSVIPWLITNLGITFHHRYRLPHCILQSPRQLFGLHVDIVALCHWAGQYQFSPQLLPVSFTHVVSPSIPFPISIHQPPRSKFKDDQVMITNRDVVHNPPTFHHVHGLGVTQSDINVGRRPSPPLICRGIIRLVCNLKPMTIDELLQSTTPSISPNHPMTMPHGRLSISISGNYEWHTCVCPTYYLQLVKIRLNWMPKLKI
uniref:Uncharacterized protein n=1 Tax=Timema douglasi TaxID=61478 RepID=A0A7R8VT81_TIMDO|nr:unnamed protein product [Timema douglasi]